MKVGDSVKHSLDHWGKNEWDAAMFHACALSNATGKKRYPQLGVAARFKADNSGLQFSVSLRLRTLEKVTATLLYLGDRSRRDRGAVAAPQHVDPDAGRARDNPPTRRWPDASTWRRR
jgi:hypothetical protein